MQHIPYTILVVYSATWCPDCRNAKRFLDEHGIPYFVLDDEHWVRAYTPKRGFDREGMRVLLGLA